MSGLEPMVGAPCVLLHMGPVLSQWVISIRRSANPGEGSSPAMIGPAPSDLEIKDLEIKLLLLPLFKCQRHFPPQLCLLPLLEGSWGGFLLQLLLQP